MSRRARTIVILCAVVGAGVFVGFVILVVVPMVTAVLAIRSAFVGDDAEPLTAPPMTVAEGRAFTFDGQSFKAGWQLQPLHGHLHPVGLEFWSDDDTAPKEYQEFVLRFTRHGVLRGTATCESDDSMEAGSPNSLTCEETPTSIRRYDRIQIGYPEQN